MRKKLKAILLGLTLMLCMPAAVYAAGSGTNVTVSSINGLKDALNHSAGTSGAQAVIHLASGTYSLSSALNIPDYTTLDLGTAVINSSSESAFKLSGKNAAISGGTIKGGGLTSSTGDGIVIENVTLTGIKGKGIYLAGNAKASRISGNTVTGTASAAQSDGSRGIFIYDGASGGDIKNNTVSSFGMGIVVYGAKMGTIASNKVSNILTYGISLQEGSAGGSITGNTVTDFGKKSSEKSEGRGIFLYTAKGSKGVTLSGDIASNNVSNGDGYGIQVSATRESTKLGSVVKGDIRNNTVKKVKSSGIAVYFGSHCGKITGNTVTDIGGNNNGDSGDYGIHIDNNLKGAKTWCSEITNNTVARVTYACITVFSGDTHVKNSALKDTAYVAGNIAGNTVSQSGYGYNPGKEWKNAKKRGCQSCIYIDSHARVYGDICGNKVSNSKENGIYLHDFSFVNNIYKNKISGMVDSGIRVWDSTVLKTIHDNTITDAKLYGIMTGGNFSMAKVAGQIYKNTLNKCAMDGIYVGGGASNSTIKGNTIAAKEYGIIVNTGASVSTITANKINITKNSDYSSGIFVNEKSSVGKITKNTISGKSHNGINLKMPKKNCTISGNTITTTSTAKQSHKGIYIRAARARKMTIKDNKLTGNKTSYGIWIDGCGGTVSGNTVSKYTSAIVTSKKVKATVSKNKCKGNNQNKARRI
ncbi:MAG: right-handed parallel beta-helix repeat-containing protein [Eubacterium sp.]|nr:right-handed parallel beta-helix repeat-containing protein [Eubacterium sp.]